MSPGVEAEPGGSSVPAVLDSLREVATSQRDLGDRFERLVQAALRTDRTYRERFSDVWLWMDWADRRMEPDTGIDLVAKTHDGQFVAIQCKFYDPGHTLVKEDIDSFFTASGREPFSQRIIISTTDRWSRHAEKALERQQIPVIRLGIDDLDSMSIDWSRFDPTRAADLIEEPRKQLRAHQTTAAEKVRAGFGEMDRGQLIMACGTGKTLTALRIAEEHVGAGGTVMFLAPSIALVSQALKEWTAECEVPIRPYAVCSDATAGRLIEGENAAPYDLPIPPTTEMTSLRQAGAAEPHPDAMTVIFSTYQSIQVVADLQTATGLVLDLVICDEAHRTAGTSDANDEASSFVKVHDDTVVPARKRLYMTATPRVYKAAAKIDAAENDVIVASMDDPETFGPEFHRLGFGEAVEHGLLADYRVLILTVEEESISRPFQQLLSSDGELNLPDVAKFVGCLSGLAKLPSRTGRAGFKEGEPPMQRAVAFWSRIDESQRFAEQFSLVAEQFNRENGVTNPDFEPIAVPTRHVDGTDRIASRREDIRWLKETPPANECRVLTNAKCLTEGVDVPALDAVMFLKPRRSKIDIVQAVGRVMRKPPGKDIGYIILPIAIPAGQDPASALDKNSDYDVVWDVLQALRSHDERFNAYINRIALRTENVGDDPDAPIEILDASPPETDSEDQPEDASGTEAIQGRLFTHEDWVGAIYTKIVNKVGTRTYWEDWADDVVDIANRQRDRINIILDGDPEVASEFDTFLTGLHSILNDGISRDDAIAMLSQHLITSPIFDALFGSDVFEANNPVAQAMQRMVEVLEAHHLDTETRNLDEFYRSVQRRVEGIPPSDGQARQTIIKDLYGRFFKKAFPQTADSLGIVYTPVEVVDFMIRATQAALTEHFDVSLSDEGVHILDPFTGTGTFITRLLQSGFIGPSDMERKYQNEIHANEFLLLAYYIAAVNIETTYNQLAARSDEDHAYHPFPGIVLTDTFQLGETGEGSGALDVFPINNERADRQRHLDLRVIIGNPPYSAGQSSQNHNAPNRGYPKLDGSIGETYAARSTATLKNSLYDSYIRAIRWASNRILNSPHGGIVAYVTNGGYIDGNTAEGLRLTLAEEFHHIYIYNLRGNARTAGERRRKEAGNVFESGSRATVAIMLLIKKPGDVPAAGASLHYRDIGDYLNREKKLDILAHGLDGDPRLDQIVWRSLRPNEHGDWINKRSDSFTNHLPAHVDDGPSIFALRTNGLKSNRDAWNWNSSRPKLESNTRRMIDHYNAQVAVFRLAHSGLSGTQKERAEVAKKFLDLDLKEFSWDRADFRRLAEGREYSLADANFMVGTYRPFHRRHTNSAYSHNNTVYQLPRVFPVDGIENSAIGVLDPGGSAPFCALMTSVLPDNKLAGAGNAMQLLPMYTYDPPQDGSRRQESLLPTNGQGRRHNVTDHALSIYQGLDLRITKDDIFFYVYGILHSPDYREAYADDLRKSLPRIPQVDTAEDFWTFSRAGRELAHLHTEYEELDPWPDLDYEIAENLDMAPEELYRVTKMRYANDDKTTIVYNDHIKITNIPERVHDYQLGARSAIDWVLETNRIRKDKKSGIINDPNDWGLERGNPTYIFDLVGQVVTVSMRTLDIIDGLPRLRLDD